MVSLINFPHHYVYTRCFFSCLNFPLVSSSFLLSNPGRRQQQPCKAVRLSFAPTGESSFKHVAVKELGGSLLVIRLKRRSFGESWCRWCKGCDDSEGEAALEEKILEFMRKSGKPDAFPSKKELMESGRMELVEEIRRLGGWWSLGWNSDEYDNGDEWIQETEIVDIDWDVKDFQKRLECSQESNFPEKNEVRRPGFSSDSINSSQPASSSGRSLESVGTEASGVEGILNRLEKQRNLSFGINLEKFSYGTHPSSEADEDESHRTASTDVGSADLFKVSRLTSDRPHKSIGKDSGISANNIGSSLQSDGLSNLLNPGTWRAWSSQRASMGNEEFQAAEISFPESQIGTKKNALDDEILGISGSGRKVLDRQRHVNHTNLKARLQVLEHELSSVLHSLRHKSLKLALKEGHEISVDDLQKLSDELEFKENEVMTELDRLRSIRAQIAVLEGKMALATIDAQKIFEEKQKRVDGARRALQLLRTACIFWPISASEVLLAGSFDGWTNKRKMKKSSTGLFLVYLKLYPGRYEIKFIVDGVWTIDPLRPIVYNNGYENNLLIIT